MATTWSSGSTMQWNPGANPMQTDGQFTFIDFLPECQDTGGIFSSPKFESFKTLVDRSNDWLRSNLSWKVKTCESVEFKRSGRDRVNSEKMTYLEHAEMSTNFIRGLRLWIEKRRSGDENYQQIGYINLIPEVQKEGGMFSFPSFEKLNDVVLRFNSMILTHPIPGRIITAETQEMKLSNWSNLDPDKCSWRERGDTQKHFVVIIRVFYEISDGISEQFGLMDFVPDKIASGGIFSHPQFEPFRNTVSKASHWCAHQHGIRVCNVQSFEMKYKSGKNVDTQRMSYTEHGGVMTLYIRILRVAFTTIPYPSTVSFTLRELTCKTFVPVQLTSSLFVPNFESLMETKHRVSEWIRATGVQVLSAETAALRMMTGGEARHGTEASFTYNRAERNEYWIFVIRLYINGYYQEPPPEMLPPVPELEQSCCIIL